jgi:hypothetical protein
VSIPASADKPALRRLRHRIATPLKALANSTDSATASAGRERPSETSIERRLAARIGAARYRMWFEEPAHLRIAGEELHVHAPSRFAADWIERHFRDDLSSVAADVGLAAVRVCADEAPGAVSPPQEAASGPREQAEPAPLPHRDQLDRLDATDRRPCGVDHRGRAERDAVADPSNAQRLADMRAQLAQLKSQAK